MKIKPDSLPYLILEVANSHGGDIASLDSIVSAFANVDYQRKAIKFQPFSATTIALPDYKNFQLYEKLGFSRDQWARTISKARRYGEVWLDIFDVFGVSVLEKNLTKISGIKLQASVVHNIEVLEALKTVNTHDLAIMINLSGYELGKTQRIVAQWSQISGEPILQVGFQGHPTPVEETGLQKVATLKQMYPDLLVSIADHAEAGSRFSSLAPIYGWLMGCEVIEKHFVSDRGHSRIDTVSAMIPEQVDRLSADLREVSAAISGNFVTAGEADYLNMSQQVSIAGQSLRSGRLVAKEDIVFRRTAQSGMRWDELKEEQKKKKVLRHRKRSGEVISLDDFRDAKVGVVVGCRLKSSRLPKKALLRIAGVESIVRCLNQCAAVDSAQLVVLATSTDDADQELYKCLPSDQIEFWAGHPDDVAARYLEACDNFCIDIVVRVPGDNPLVSPEIIEELLVSHFDKGADFTKASESALGSGAEVITVDALRHLMKIVGTAPHSEYLTWYFVNNPEIFRVNMATLPSTLVRNSRLTLDYDQDLQFLREVFAYLDTSQKYQSIYDVFKVIDANPHLYNLNAGLDIKDQADQSLIKRLRRESKIGARRF